MKEGEGNELTRHRLDSGQSFSAEVDRIASSGNAIIETVGGHLNLGRLDPSVVGETIEAEYVWGPWAACQDTEFIPAPDEYDPPEKGASRSSPSSNDGQESDSSGGLSDEWTERKANTMSDLGNFGSG